MMNILIPLLLCVFAGFGTLVGSLLVFVPIKRYSTFISACLSFSGTVMILISIFDLLPSSVYNIITNYRLLWGLFIISITFLFGYLIISLIDKKIEKGSSLEKVGILAFLTLILHNFPEGIATFMTSYVDITLGIKLSVAIMLHNIPEGIVISVPIATSTGNKLKGIKYAFISSLAEPIGALFAFVFLYKIINNITISIILIGVASIMITLSINNLYKESLKNNIYKYFVYGIILGIIYIFLSLSI